VKTNLTYIVSNINKSLAFEWIATYIDKNKYQLNFILLNPGDSELEKYLVQNNIKVERVKYSSKTDLLSAIFKCFRILRRNNTKIVHTHLFNANMIGLTAAWLARVPKRIYTRHHSDYHHRYYPGAVKFDRYANHLSTDIIAISEVVKKILTTLENVPENKIHLIHHGFKLENFSNISAERMNALKKQYKKDNEYPVIGVISRYIELKGIQYIIPAFSKLLESYPDALLILANANGEYKNEIQTLLKKLPSKNYIEISFEADIFSLYTLFDVFIHTPIAPEVEAFGQTYVEALASGIPSIFTLSGIAHEFIKDHHNALIVPYQNSDAILTSINSILEDKILSKKLIENGKNDVRTMFELKKMILSLEKLYE
jgi:glycosyltransferase involved in cell wall biosynthesis